MTKVIDFVAHTRIFVSRSHTKRRVSFAKPTVFKRSKNKESRQKRQTRVPDFRFMHHASSTVSCRPFTVKSLTD